MIAQARQDWRIALEAIAPERLVVLDESAALTNMVHTHARSPRGSRAYGTIPVRSLDAAHHAGGARDGGHRRRHEH